MSNKMRYRYGPLEMRSVKKTGTVAIELGDMIKETSAGKCAAVSASADADDLIGIAMSASPATDATATTIRIAAIGHGTVFEMIAASATYYYGDGFAISAAQTLVKYDGTVTYATATNVVAMCIKDGTTAGASTSTSIGTVLVSFKPGLMNKEIATS